MDVYKYISISILASKYIIAFEWFCISQNIFLECVLLKFVSRTLNYKRLKETLKQGAVQ